MDERYRTVLERNRGLLIKNIILTDGFYDLLLKEKVLPQSMIADVKEEGLSRDERVARLLSGLQLRTSAAFRRFRRVLLATGHCFLADVLWEEEPTSGIEELISSRFPAIFDRVPDDVRKKLINSLDTLVQEKNMMTSWQVAPHDRVEVIKSRAADFKQERHLRYTVDTLQSQVQSLQTELREKEEQVCSLTIEVESMGKEMEKLKQDHLSDIEKQANFNTANSKSIMRLKERFDMVNRSIADVNYRLRSFLGEDAEQCEGDPDNVKITLLEKNLLKVLELANSGRENAASKSSEKETICAILGVKKSKYADKSLTEIIKAYLQKDEKAKFNLLKELQKLSEVMTRDSPILSDPKLNQYSGKTEMRLLTMQVAMVHAQLEHLHKKLIWKDTEINTLKQEVQILKKTIANAKARPRTRAPSPEMTREMKVAYANVDDYLNDERQEMPTASTASLPMRSVVRVKPGHSKTSSQGGPRRQFSMPLCKDYDSKPAHL